MCLVLALSPLLLDAVAAPVTGEALFSNRISQKPEFSSERFVHTGYLFT